MTPMRTLPRHATTVVTAVMLAAVAACRNDDPGIGNDLEQDLAAARASSLELAPSGRKTEVVSAVERLPAGTRAAAPRQAPPARSTPARQTAARSAPEPRPAPTSRAPARVAQAPDTAVTAPAPAPAPRPQPVHTQQAPPGGYKSVGEVIRDAPFPINP
jgi:hypothetical protein